jgi:chitinase
MYPKLKVLISIGGWSWSGRFSDAAKPENRVEFVKSCIDLFIKGNLPMWAKIDKDTPDIGRDNNRAEGVFDGIDIDWEYPASPAFEGDPKRELPPNVYRPEDTQNFTALLAEFRTQLDEIGKEKGKHYLLTIAVPAGESLYSKIELGKVADIVDFMNLMAYDMHGTGGDAAGPTNFQAPLYTSPDDPSDEPISVDSAVQGYLKAGVPPQKIVLGVPFYGHGWTNVPEKDNGLYQSDSKMVQAPGKWEAGIEDYKILKKLGFPEFRDPKTQSMWIYDGKTWWSYDDPQVITAKMDYIKKQKLGGTMFWSLDGDDGTLVQAIHDGLSGK